MTMLKTGTELISVAQLLRRLRDVTSNVSKAVKGKIEKQLGPVTCKPNCSYCCYQKILAPTFVGVHIYLYLKHQGMWTKELRAKLVESDLSMTARTHRGWLMGRRPCPFLEEHEFGNGRCTIYPVRPEVCAITFSVAGDGRKCAEVDERNLASVVNDEETVQYLSLVMAVEKLCKPIITTLPASVLLAEAAAEHLPVPDVVSIPHANNEPPEDGWIERTFDSKFATVPDGE